MRPSAPVSRRCESQRIGEGETPTSPYKPLTPNNFIPIVPPLNAPVAQLDRVPGYEPGGRTFESCQARHLNKKGHPKRVAFFV